MTRRNFIKHISVVTATLLYPFNLQAAPSSEVVVVGGGFAGATCAKYLKLWGGSSVNVTLVEPNDVYVSPILSNLILNAQKTINDISFNYTSHVNNYKVNVVHKSVSNIDKVAKQVLLNDSSSLSYDSLVLAPGIDFIAVNGQDFSKIPHAWIAGEQTTLLQEQIDTMVDGDEFVMNIPASPYRCPPGPYERACVVADYLKNVKGFSNSKVTVLDTNADIIIEKDTFATAFNSYGIEYISSTTITSVDSDAKSVTYTKDEQENTKSAKVLNVIPNQKAASIIFAEELNVGNWASVDPISYESTLSNDIYIIGDSQGTSQPKAGHIANSEAKVCADAILRKINDIALYHNPKTNSACYSPISTTEASWLTAVYEYDSDNLNMKLVDTQVYPASGAPSSRNYSKMFDWSTNLFQDTFG